MARGKLPPDAVWPFAGMVAGAVLGALISSENSLWPFYLLTVVGTLAGYAVNAVVKQR